MANTGSKWGYVFVAVALVAVIGGGVWFWVNRLPPVIDPVTKAGSTNAYDYFVAAGNAIQDEKTIEAAFFHSPLAGGGEGIPADQRAAVVKKNALALRMLRRGFDFDFRQRSGETGSRLTAPYMKFRTLSRLLILEGLTRDAEGDRMAAIGSFMDLIRFGSENQRDGTIIAMLVGSALEAPGRLELWKRAKHLNASEARFAAKRLDGILAHPMTYAEVVKGEKRFAHQSLSDTLYGKLSPDVTGNLPDDQKRLFLLPEATKQEVLRVIDRRLDACVAYARLPYGSRFPKPRIIKGKAASIADRMMREVTPMLVNSRFGLAKDDSFNRLLGVALALQAYRMEHDAYPKKLAELAPEYLSAIPSDPFAPKRLLRYRLAGGQYVLYSVGPDLRDDGGKPIYLAKSTSLGPDPARRYAVERDSRGDVVAGVNTR